MVNSAARRRSENTEENFVYGTILFLGSSSSNTTKCACKNHDTIHTAIWFALGEQSCLWKNFTPHLGLPVGRNQIFEETERFRATRRLVTFVIIEVCLKVIAGTCAHPASHTIDIELKLSSQI